MTDVYIPSAFYPEEKRLDRVPVTFGIILPTGDLLTNYMLYCQVNPNSFDEEWYRKQKEYKLKVVG